MHCVGESVQVFYAEPEIVGLVVPGLGKVEGRRENQIGQKYVVNHLDSHERTCQDQQASCHVELIQD